MADLLHFPPQPLLPLGQAHAPPLVPHLAGAHLNSHVGGGPGDLGGHVELGPANGGVEVKSEGMDAMLEMFLRVRAAR